MSFKVRVRFRKAGTARFLSHHDLIRAFERMLRRAQLPIKFTEGFHPKPKMSFPSALGLGIVGHQEVFEVELAEELPLAEVEQRLAAQMLPGMAVLSVHRLASNKPGQPIRATYLLRLSPETEPRLAQAVSALLAQAELLVERERPQRRTVDLRPWLLALERTAEGLRMTLAITPTGAARPEEILRLLHLSELLGEGAVLERTELCLADELIAADDFPAQLDAPNERALPEAALHATS